MNSLANRKALAIAIAAGMVGTVALVAACSSSNNGTGNGSPDGSTGSGGDGSTSGQAGSCSNSTVPIIFSPMYSAFIPNSTAQTFQIPAVTGDGNTATWSLSDPSQANMQPQSFDVDGTMQPGVMITIAGIGAGGTTSGTTGTVTVIATESDGSCGAATLTITQNTEDDWTTGNARYNNGNNLHFGGGGGGRPDGGFPEGGFTRPEAGAGGGGGGLGGDTDGGSIFETDGGTACTSCHGQQPQQPLFKDVQHTPEQTGGFSDQDLQDIILTGTVPDGGYFDPSVLDGLLHQTCDDAGTTVGPDMPACAQKAYTTWQGFHKWTDIGSDEIPGVICYLRSLTPAAQTGNSNFGGGGGHRDGGFGGGHHDGGGMPQGNDSGSETPDTGTSTSDDASLGAD